MTQEEIFEIVVDHTREVLPGLETHAFKPDDSLRDLGANSVDRSEIVMLTLESLSLAIPLIELAQAQNLGDLARTLHERAGAAAG